MSRLLVVSTCGTSLLTNLAREDQSGQLSQLVINHANQPAAENLPPDERQKLKTLLERAKNELSEADSSRQRKLSAELNGLQLLRREQGADTQYQHWLITSDTWLGRGAGECIAAALEKQHEQTVLKDIKGLRTNDPINFREGVAELARLCAQEINGMRKGGWRVVFNLTGGFKAVQGFMQALGMRYADDIVYVFERTDALLHIPRLPAELDALEILRRHQQVFRRLAANLAVAPEDVMEMPETLYDRVEDVVDLSVWGHALWNEAKDRLLEEKLWPPVSEKLQFGDKFEKSVESVCAAQPDRLRLVNERLLQLARHLEEPAYNPKSLNFKALQGKHPPWTHECYAWTDRDAKRLYGHFEDGVFVLDQLGNHL